MGHHIAALLIVLLFLPDASAQVVATKRTVNLALGKPTWQSSTQSNYVSSLAVDGNKIQSGVYCAMTASGDTKPWWTVDLGKPTNVYGVNVTGLNGYGSYMNSFIVGLTNDRPSSSLPSLTSNPNSFKVCGQWPGTPPDGEQFVRCAPNLPPSRYVVILGQMPSYYLIICEVEVYQQDSCRTILAADPEAPSGEYSIRTSTGRILDKVYCEMGLNGGGYTFLNPFDLPTLTDAELQAIFTDKTSFLMRVVMENETQPYGVLKQLIPYRTTDLSISLNSNDGYMSPVNVYDIGTNYIYYGFLPISKSPAVGTTLGLVVNSVSVTFVSCSSTDPNSYFALFPNFHQATPSSYSTSSVPGPFYDRLIAALKPVPSGRPMPAEYFMFMETQWGGCGAYAQTDGRPGLNGVQLASIGFR